METADEDQRRDGFEELITLTQDPSNHVALVEQEKFTAYLTSVLAMGTPSTKQQAVNCFQNIATSPQAMLKMLEDPLFSLALLGVLNTRDVDAQATVLKLFRDLTNDKENGRAILKRIEGLFKYVSPFLFPSQPEEHQTYATGITANIARLPEGAHIANNLAAVKSLGDLITSPGYWVRTHAMQSLWALIADQGVPFSKLDMTHTLAKNLLTIAQTDYPDEKDLAMWIMKIGIEDDFSLLSQDQGWIDFLGEELALLETPKNHVLMIAETLNHPGLQKTHARQIVERGFPVERLLSLVGAQDEDVRNRARPAITRLLPTNDILFLVKNMAGLMAGAVNVLLSDTARDRGFAVGILDTLIRKSEDYHHFLVSHDPFLQLIDHELVSDESAVSGKYKNGVAAINQYGMKEYKLSAASLSAQWVAKISEYRGGVKNLGRRDLLHTRLISLLKSKNSTLLWYVCISLYNLSMDSANKKIWLGNTALIQALNDAVHHANPATQGVITELLDFYANKQI